jgi:hypothetical protein
MWSDTARMPRLIGPVDARVAVFFMIWALHMSWYTFYVSISGIVVFSILPYFGISMTNAFRWVAQKISGKHLHAGDPAWKYRYRCGL